MNDTFFSVGRQQSQDLDLSKWDASNLVSKEHAELIYESEKWKIVRKEETVNHVKVNGKKLSNGENCILANDDEIVFANIKFKFVIN